MVLRIHSIPFYGTGRVNLMACRGSHEAGYSKRDSKTILGDAWPIRSRMSLRVQPNQEDTGSQAIGSGEQVCGSLKGKVVFPTLRQALDRTQGRNVSRRTRVRHMVARKEAWLGTQQHVDSWRWSGGPGMDLRSCGEDGAGLYWRRALRLYRGSYGEIKTRIRAISICLVVLQQILIKPVTEY